MRIVSHYDPGYKWVHHSACWGVLKVEIIEVIETLLLNTSLKISIFDQGKHMAPTRYTANNVDIFVAGCNECNNIDRNC
ncbi:hypothetical protein PNOK_0466100 [Pyrrhoderma noxium]|uniref:Uncharacterized protein n=1 Tax=Pyrrhoderma noxium TaxID=2282107 RepID=A0A286UJF4_9AGAM|nr:hypothetical protein PNOK_0466100 [Pyrrhoderma noxium]